MIDWHDFELTRFAVLCGGGCCALTQQLDALAAVLKVMGAHIEKVSNDVERAAPTEQLTRSTAPCPRPVLQLALWQVLRNRSLFSPILFVACFSLESECQSARGTSARFESELKALTTRCAQLERALQEQAKDHAAALAQAR